MANIIRIGGGGSSPTLITKSITQNGTYYASADNADGYASVDVEVAGGSGTRFIFSTAQQYLLLPSIYGNADYTYKFKLIIPSYNTETLIFGSNWNVGAKLFHTYGSLSSPVIYYFINNSATSIPYTYWDILEVEASTSYIKVNGTSYSGSPSTRYNEPVYFFGLNGSRLSAIGISEIQIYDNSDDSLVMDLVPMQDTTTGAGYYHDTVGNMDYYSGSAVGFKYVELVDNSN